MRLTFLKRGLFAAGLAILAAAGSAAVTTTSADARVCPGYGNGRYVNVNPGTRGITRLYLARSCRPGRFYVVKIYGKCHPRDCSWRPVVARYVGHGIYRGYINQGFARRRFVIRVRAGRMTIRVYTNFTDPNRRDYVATYRMRRA